MQSHTSRLQRKTIRILFWKPQPEVLLAPPRWLAGDDAAVCWSRTGQEGIHLVCVSPWEVPSTDCVAFCSWQKVSREPSGAAAAAAGPERRYVLHTFTITLTTLLLCLWERGGGNPLLEPGDFVSMPPGYTSGCLPCLLFLPPSQDLHTSTTTPLNLAAGQCDYSVWSHFAPLDSKLVFIVQGWELGRRFLGR